MYQTMTVFTSPPRSDLLRFACCTCWLCSKSFNIFSQRVSMMNLSTTEPGRIDVIDLQKKIKRIRENNMASPTTVTLWKEKPPGKEQNELERMFRSREIDSKTTADTVRKGNAMFMKFSAQVFGAHFRKTKARLGLSAVIPDEDAGTGIPELGGGSQIQSFLGVPQNEAEYEREPIEYRNAPHWTWVYTDHEKKMDFVCVALPIISGTRKNKFIISEDGMRLTVQYQWPLAMLKADQLFENVKVDNVKISLNHPKVHAFLTNQLESGMTANSNPLGVITIDLPKQVKRESRTWKKEAVQHGDTQIMFIEFSAYQKSIIIDDADTTIEF